MSSATLHRLSGLSLLLGSAFVSIGVIPIFFVGDDAAGSLGAMSALLRVVGAMLIVLGLPGVYGKESGRLGALGLIGFALTALYLLIMGVAGDTINAFVIPFLAVKAPALLSGSFPTDLTIFLSIGQLFGLVGGALLGIAVVRTAAPSRWAGAFLIGGAILSFAGNFALPIISTVGILVFFVGLLWLSLGAWSTQSAAPQSQLPVRPAQA